MNRPLSPPSADTGRVGPWYVGQLRFWVMVVGVAGTITGYVVLTTGQPAWRTFAYALTITIGCATCIGLCLRTAIRLFGERRPGWPSLPWTVAALLLGTLAGYTLGTLAGNLLTGREVPTPLSGLSRSTVASLAFALLPGTIIVGYLYHRERLAQAEAQAQQAERLAAENQLRLLQSQLEPHMLFNTLANLRVLIGLDPPRAQAMLDRLIAFLRATLAASRLPRHPLREEFARVDDYLSLMAVRMASRLQVRLDLPEALAALPVPPMLLQPLVENAIKHGLEPKVGGGRIEVGARRDGARLLMHVRDTGVGPGGAATSGTQFGLDQVRQRLRTLYGDGASLHFAAADDAEGGAVVTLTLPLPETDAEAPR